MSLGKSLSLSEPQLSSSAKWAGIMAAPSLVCCEIALVKHLAQYLVCNRGSINVSDHPVLPLFHDDENLATLETSHGMSSLPATLLPDLPRAISICSFRAQSKCPS